MSSSSELLFVGGGADGRRYRVRTTDMIMYIAKDIPTVFNRFNEVPEEYSPFEIEVYRKERLCGSSKTFEVMLLEGLTGEDLIERLIKNYISVACNRSLLI